MRSDEVYHCIELFQIVLNDGGDTTKNNFDERKNKADQITCIGVPVNTNLRRAL